MSELRLRLSTLVLASLAALQPACGGATEGSGSSTHFLARCSDDIPCGEGLSCFCGRCSAACARDKDCRDLGDDVACGAANVLSSQCSSSQASVQACVLSADIAPAMVETDSGVAGAATDSVLDDLVPPDVRGAALDLEPFDIEAVTGCCTRSPEGSISAMCPPGSDQRKEGILTAAGDIVSLSGTPATLGVSFQIRALTTPEAEVAVLLVETINAPPLGVADLSPVFWLAATGSLPALDVRVPISNAGGGYSPDAIALYHSADGEVFTPLGDSYLNAGFVTATLLEAGFLVVGATADGVQCGDIAPGGGGAGAGGAGGAGETG